MKFRLQRIVVPITGGLGNQLFQLSFALHYSQITKLPFVLEESIAKPRLTSSNASICSLQLGENLIPTIRANGKISSLATKVYGWNLVNGIRGKSSKFLGTELLTNFISSVVFSLATRIWSKIHISKGLGFDSEITKSGLGGFFIGYFQTYKFSVLEGVFNQLMQLRPKSISTLLSENLAVVDLIRPILLHVRLTDYRSEESFGIPDGIYYLESLRFLKKIGAYKPVWVFSDDIAGAKEHLSGIEKEFQLHFFESDSLSDVENWYLMRGFSAYVIANSSYSWWAAYLRKDQHSFVVYPHPWFDNETEPKNLFPINWIPIPAKQRNEVNS